MSELTVIQDVFWMELPALINRAGEHAAYGQTSG
jgi:hypothetical protein